MAALDATTERAARAFLGRIAPRYDVAGAILFGSRARGEARPDSDADLAVVLRGTAPARRIPIAVDMAGDAFDVMLETGILVEALPVWEGELARPEAFHNPRLLEAICRDGIRL